MHRDVLDVRTLAILTAATACFGIQAKRESLGAVTHFVYIVRCVDGTLYTGYARDPHKRVQAHNAGRGARYTSGRRPVYLVYTEAFRSRTNALKREYRLKRLSRPKKEALIQGWTVVIEKDSPVGTLLPTSKMAMQ